MGFSATLRVCSYEGTSLQSVNLIQLFGVEVPIESIHLILEDVVQTHKDRVHRRQTRLLVRSDVTCVQMPAYFKRSSKQYLLVSTQLYWLTSRAYLSGTRSRSGRR